MVLDKWRRVEYSYSVHTWWSTTYVQWYLRPHFGERPNKDGRVTTGRELRGKTWIAVTPIMMMDDEMNGPASIESVRGTRMECYISSKYSTSRTEYQG